MEKRFFVVIHTITNGLQHAFDQAKLAKEAGAHGVFLIPDYMKGHKRATTEDQFLYLKELKRNLLDFPIGINFLKPLPNIYFAEPDFLQTDSSAVSAVQKKQLPKTKFFLGLAFKYSKSVHLTGNALREHCKNVSALADVPTTSGDATGSAASIEKIREIRSYLSQDKRLGIASGVTEENVHLYLKEGVTDFLVATSLIDRVVGDADILSFSKISRMAELIKHSHDK